MKAVKEKHNLMDAQQATKISNEYYPEKLENRKSCIKYLIKNACENGNYSIICKFEETDPDFFKKEIYDWLYYKCYIINLKSAYEFVIAWYPK